MRSDLDIESSAGGKSPVDLEIDTFSSNTYDLLQKGILETEKDSYTMLLVGKTGAGKSTFITFMANLARSTRMFHYDHRILDRQNETGGSQSQSQTQTARLYVFETTNGVKLRILDSPGLSDTRGKARDEMHKKSIIEEMSTKMTVLDAVIIFENGKAPRTTSDDQYVLETLSALFPKTLANNIALIFTRVNDESSCQVERDRLPPILKDARSFYLENPIALEEEFRKIQKQGNPSKLRRKKREVEDGEEAALETMADFFDWLKSVESQPTTDFILLYERSKDIKGKIDDILARITQYEDRKREIEKLQKDSKARKLALSDSDSELAQIMNKPLWKLEESTTNNTLCTEVNCYSNCHIDCLIGSDSAAPTALVGCVAMWSDPAKLAENSSKEQRDGIPLFVVKILLATVVASLATLAGVEIAVVAAGATLLGMGAAFLALPIGVLAAAGWAFTVRRALLDKVKCKQCGHSVHKHSHYRALWKATIDPLESIPVDETDQTRKLIDRLNASTNESVRKLFELVSEYSQLSLSGTLSKHVTKIIEALEQRIQIVQSDQAQKRTLVDSLVNMKSMLNLLQKREDY